MNIDNIIDGQDITNKHSWIKMRTEMIKKEYEKVKALNPAYDKLSIIRIVSANTG